MGWGVRPTSWFPRHSRSHETRRIKISRRAAWHAVRRTHLRWPYLFRAHPDIRGHRGRHYGRVHIYHLPFFSLTGESMSTPNPTVPAPSPALVAASPYLKQAIDDIIAAVTTITTGEAALAPARVGPALGILVNQLVLLEPGVLAAEQGVVQTDVIADLNA